jgi:hypothetical protein
LKVISARYAVVSSTFRRIVVWFRWKIGNIHVKLQRARRRILSPKCGEYMVQQDRRRRKCAYHAIAPTQQAK